MNDTMHFGSVLKALMHYFEMTPAALIKDWKLLTAVDKKELTEGLSSLGYTWDAGAKP